MDPLAKALQVQALEDVKATARSAGRNAALYAIACVLVLFALGALLTALWVWLWPYLGPAVAAVTIAAALIVLALLLVAFNMWLNRRERQKHRIRHALGSVRYSAVLATLPYVAKASSPLSLLAVGAVSFAVTRWWPRGSADD